MAVDQSGTGPEPLFNPNAQLDPSQVYDARSGAPVDPLTAPLHSNTMGVHGSPQGMGHYYVDNTPIGRKVRQQQAAAKKQAVVGPTATAVAHPHVAPHAARAAAAATSAWGDPNAADYAQQNIVTIYTDGLSFQVNENVATQMAGFVHALVQQGYHPKSVQGYNNRPVKRPDGTYAPQKSNHAYGAAIDIDPGANPQYDAKGGKYALPPSVGQLAAQYGLVWGGNYTKSKDYMHFEAATAPQTPKALGQQALTGTTSGGGVTANSTTAPTPVAGPMTDQQVIDYVESHYGYASVFLHDKEIGPILIDAAKRGLGADELKGKLINTKWWKTHSNSQVTWQNLNATNPAEAKAQIAGMTATLQRQAADLGVVLNPLQLHDMSIMAISGGWNSDQVTAALHAQGKADSRPQSARQWDLQTQQDPATQHQAVINGMGAIGSRATQLGSTVHGLALHDLTVRALREGWSQQQIDQALVAGGLDTSGKQPSAALTSLASLKQKSAEYLVPLSDQALNQWMTKIAAGQVQATDFDAYLKEQAKILRPWMAKQIDAGVTPSQYADPYRQYAAQLLEKNPDSIDLMNDPKYSLALDNVDPKTGERGPMSFSAWQQYLRSTPDYKQTAQAVDQGAKFANLLTQTFGKVSA